jgi:protoheme IX farnesyltransferase
MSTTTVLFPNDDIVRPGEEAREMPVPGLADRALDYLELTKPKIALLELLTVAVSGCVASWNSPDAWALFHALVGTALVASSASALNQWLERERDRHMPRTAGRPLPAGRLSNFDVLAFGASSGLAGVLYLATRVNLTTAGFGLLTWLLYVVVYTPLKPRTPLNTVVGAVAGGLPVLMGWTAVGGTIGLPACTLFLIVFLWQFPHFMAIAWIYRDQYAAAGMRMLPVVDPTGRRAGLQAVVAALALVPVSLVPAVVSFAGPLYFVWALLLGLGQLAAATWFLRRRDDFSARVLLRASLIYLPTLLVMLMLGPFV